MPPEVGTWVGASAVHGRPVPVDQPYPHIHGHHLIGPTTGRPLVVERKDCAACHRPARPASRDRLPVVGFADLARVAERSNVELRAHSQAALRAARGYIQHGWPVFLLGRSKRPLANCAGCPKDAPDHDPAACSCLTCHGFYAATLDVDRFAAMLDAHPDGLVAIRTGAASGLVVVDVDPRNGGAIDHTLMTPTATVATGGGGWHLYYRHPGVALPAKVPGHRGVDIKTDGGYAVAPPSCSRRTGRPYRWVGDRPVVEMPRRLLDACQPRSWPPAPVAPAPTSPGGRGISSPAALLAAHLDAVRRAPQGQRRHTLYGAARGAARMVAAGAITHENAVTALTDVGRHAEQTDRDIRAAITGGFRAEGVAA